MSSRETAVKPEPVELSAAALRERSRRNRVLGWAHVGLALLFLVLFVIVRKL